MLISSKNTFTETSRIIFVQTSKYHGLAKLTHRISYYKWPDGNTNEWENVKKQKAHLPSPTDIHGPSVLGAVWDWSGVHFSPHHPPARSTPLLWLPRQLSGFVCLCWDSAQAGFLGRKKLNLYPSHSREKSGMENRSIQLQKKPLPIVFTNQYRLVVCVHMCMSVPNIFLPYYEYYIYIYIYIAICFITSLHIILHTRPLKKINTCKSVNHIIVCNYLLPVLVTELYYTVHWEKERDLVILCF